MAILDFVNKNLGGFEAGDVMLVDHDGSVARNVPGDLLLPLFIDEAAKTTYVNILTAGHVLLHNGKECFHRGGHIGFVDARLFCNLIDNVCLRHVIE